MKKNKNFIVANGFSLTELSIVIAIISIILGASFSLILGNTNVAKQKDTENRMKIIEAAIAGFVASYNRLPCGGDITVAASTATAGTEMSSCAGQAYYIVESPAPTSPTTFQSSDVATMVIGSVPYTALKLPKEYIADAWGNKFIYAITKPLSTYSFQYTNMGVIPVRDTTSSYRTNNAAYVLMSSGANGYGGFPMNSTSAQRMVVPTDPGEVINYNTVQAPSSNNSGAFIAMEPTSTFDDIVHYKQKWQVVKEAGYVLSNTTCAQANLYIETQDYNLGSVNYSPLCQNNPTDPNCTSYVTSMMYKIKELCLNQKN